MPCSRPHPSRLSIKRQLRAYTGNARTILPLLAQSWDQLLDQNLLGTKPQAQKTIADAKVRSDFLHQGIGPFQARFERLHNSRAMGGAVNGEKSLGGVA